MATSVNQIRIPPVDEKRLGGLRECERHEIYGRAEYSRFHIAQLEGMVAESGQRTVGKGALNNVKVRLASMKNRAVRVMESHTVERALAYELELDPRVRGYYVQVPCRRIERLRENGTSHVSAAILDFLVFYDDHLELVECKAAEWLDTHCDEEWVETSSGWTCVPYENWAKERSIPFRVYVPPCPVANYLRTYEAMYAIKHTPLTYDENRCAARSLALLAKRPHSIEELEASVPDFNSRIALSMLADQRCFGLLKSTPIGIDQHFYLYADRHQADEIDAEKFKALIANTGQPSKLSKLAMATTTDFAGGLSRLNRLERIKKGFEAPTARMSLLAAKIDAAVEQGEAALSACLTNYAKCGNRESRFNFVQMQCIDWAIRVLWNRGKVRTRKALWFELEKECHRNHVEPPSRKTLNRYLRREDAMQRALATGGTRAYQAAKPVSDPLVRSGTAIGYGHTLHIDSSKFDHRSHEDVEFNLAGDIPWFYIGIDETTLRPMAYSIYFGRACTNGVALLLREFVRRHRFLPHVIVLDRGSENDSLWLQAFCLEKNITLLQAPTAGSRFNGQAESAIKRINDNVAHDLPGSTEPDMKGRKVDGKFKSVKTCRLAFMTICKACDHYVYGDMPNTADKDDRTPIDRMEEAIGRYGVMGTPQELDVDFLIATSVTLKFKGRATEKRGIRTEYGIFTSEPLRFLLRTCQPDEVRQDCEDPSTLFVKIKSAWIKAFHSTVLTMAALTPREQLFALLWKPYAMRKRRKHNQDVDRKRHFRHQELATSALPEAVQDASSIDDEAKTQASRTRHKTSSLLPGASTSLFKRSNDHDKNLSSHELCSSA